MGPSGPGLLAARLYHGHPLQASLGVLVLRVQLQDGLPFGAGFGVIAVLKILDL